MGDESQVTIPCGECGPGYEHPTGKVNRPIYSTKLREAVITKVEIEADGVEYQASCGVRCAYCYKEKDLFLTEAEALEAGKVLAAEYQKKEDERYKQKVKPHRTWAFNASYHRQRMKQAEKDLVYHTKALNWAQYIKKTEKAEQQLAEQAK